MISSAVILLWAASLVFLLTRPVGPDSIWWIPPGILAQTFLYTGLFITAHDAMHGSIAPGRKHVNRFFGTLCVILYALFSYRRLLEKHHEHHRHPGTNEDPDFHDGQNEGFFAWYFNFIKTYVTIWQLLGMAVAFNLLEHFVGVPIQNLLLFWVLPSLLSTVQLFYFGTWLVHRPKGSALDHQHHARSNDYPAWLSFFTCYHFGYHLEHHTAPWVPWWRLPSARRSLKKTTNDGKINEELAWD